MFICSSPGDEILGLLSGQLDIAPVTAEGIASGLYKLVAALDRRRHVLLTGPSGAGKSALIWLTASILAGKMRWFEIARTATATHAASLMRFIRSRRPTEESPIAVAFDDIGPVGSDLWNVLVRELRGLPAVYLLGSVRQEDLALISNQSDNRRAQCCEPPHASIATRHGTRLAKWFRNFARLRRTFISSPVSPSTQ